MTTAMPPSLARRSAVWLYIAAMGNLAIVAAAFIAAVPPISIDPGRVYGFLYPFAAELFSPELLIFTSLISVLIAFGMSKEARGEVREAARLVAWTVRLGLTVVLSFAVVVAAPASLARVIFALLLGFITFVLAERLDAPAQSPVAEAAQQLTLSLRARETWATASLGSDRGVESRRRVWTRFSVLVVAPIVLQAAFAIVAALATKGAAFAFSPHWIVVSLVSGYGSLLYSFAWLSTADKAESPPSRAWRGSAFAMMGVAANGALAWLFFASELVEVAWLTIFLISAHGVALLARARPFYRGVLDDTATWLTERHLANLRSRRSALHSPVGGEVRPTDAG